MHSFSAYAQNRYYDTSDFVGFGGGGLQDWDLKIRQLFT